MSTTRRAFVASTLTASAYAQIAGSNERLRVGVIGCGGQAQGHMKSLVRTKEQDNVEIVAVCDVFDKRAREASQLTGGRVIKDYRDLLAAKDIDYVLIATPEHWHYQMTLDALAAGKHIYCEKPMTHTVEQAKHIAARIGQSDRKVQIGVQGMSDDSYETAHKYVKEGALGKVVIAQIDYSRNYADDFWAYPIDADARPGENLDWHQWLGPAPKRAWDADRCFRWRRYWDYSGGIATDLFIHRATRIIKALNLDFPERGTGAGGKYEYTNSLAEIPDTLNIMLEYAGGPTVLLVSSLANSTKVDHVLRGHKATLTFTPTGFTISPQPDYAKELKEIVYEKHGAESLELHHRNLMNAIRLNESLKCDATLGYKGVVACAMGVDSFRQRKYLAWDKTKEKLVHA